MRSSEGPLTGRGARVLLLGARADSFSADPPWPDGFLSIRLSAACPEQVDRAGQLYPVRQLRPGDFSGRDALRTLGAWGKSRVMARRAGVRADWLWIIKRDRWLRKTLRDTDVLVSMDGETDRVLDLVPELLHGGTRLRYAERPSLPADIRALHVLMARLREVVTERQVSHGIVRRALDASERTALDSLVDPVLASPVPPELLPTTELAELVRALGPAVGQASTAEIVLEVLGRISWAQAPGLGTSGIAAQQASARLLRATTASDLPGEQTFAAAAAQALVGADQALANGDPVLARGRLLDAMGVLFHRERHAETISSPLVTDPAGHLEPLWSSRTFREVVAGGRPPRLRTVSSRVDQPRVLVLAGAYGTFHEPVVTALSAVAAVTVRGPKLVPPFLTRRELDPQALEALAALRGAGPKEGQPDPWGALQVNDELIQALGARLRRTDVVFTDWADRLTVWASHLVPDGVRLVLRIHSLDALDPWFHLVDWRNIDQVLVVSEPLRRLVEQMLRGVGAYAPVTVVPNLIALQEVDQPKAPYARNTLGMVGWGRRVKDPLWALDLLARLPTWRLLLIGPDLVQGFSGMAKAYTERVRARLLDPTIADRVEVVGRTDDVAGELRRVGVILSTSRRESWHLGLVEGAASGAVPVVRDWPMLAPVGGARALFPDEWVVDDLDGAEARVRSVAEPAAWEAARREAQQQARDLFDPEPAAQRYRELILGTPLSG